MAIVGWLIVATVVLGVLIAVVIALACCRVASDADRRIEHWATEQFGGPGEDGR